MAKTVLFYPYNSAGHINSSIAIADRLKRDFGYRTVFLVVGKTLNQISDHGHELIVLEDAYRPEGSDRLEDSNPMAKQLVKIETDLGGDPIRGIQALARLIENDFVPRTVTNFEQVSKAMDSINADVIVSDYILQHPKIIQEQNFRPWVGLFSVNPLGIVKSILPNGEKPPAYIGCQLLTKEKRAKLRAEEPDRWRMMVDEWIRASDIVQETIERSIVEIRKIFAASGIEDAIKPGSMFIESPHLNIYLYPEELDYDQDDDLFKYPPRHVRCNSLIRPLIGPTDTEESSLWARRVDEAMARGKEKMIYFSLGSLASGNVNLLRPFIEMLARDSDKRRLYVISKGANGDRLELNEENMIGGNYLPQNYLLQRSHLAIIHGGNNSVTECAYYGKPMIVLPVFVDQFDNAQRIEDLGLGRRLTVQKCTQEELMGAIDEILSDEGLIARVRAIGEKMRTRDDAGKVSRLIRKLVEEKQLADKTVEEFAAS